MPAERGAELCGRWGHDGRVRAGVWSEASGHAQRVGGHGHHGGGVQGEVPRQLLVPGLRRRGDGRGCIMWADDLLDMRYVDKGQDLYLRLAESELTPAAAAVPPSLPSRPRAFPTGPVIGAVGSLVGILLVAFLVLVVIRRRRRRRPSNIGKLLLSLLIQNLRLEKEGKFQC